MNAENKAAEIFNKWLSASKTKKGEALPRGAIGAALVVLEKLKTTFDLNIENHLAKGGAQIQGLTTSSVAKVLANYGETRPFLKEGGRTNRGGPAYIKSLLNAIDESGVGVLPAKDRNNVIVSLQQIFVKKVEDYHNSQKLRLFYDGSKSTWTNINELLKTAREAKKDGPVAQYLVGAKLQLRFPELSIGNESYSTADDQLGRQGDFLVGETVFHVTVAAQQALFDKCKINTKKGYMVYLVVPDFKVGAARALAENSGIDADIIVTSVELFVAQNLNEISVFSRSGTNNNFKTLIEIYNSRVEAVESDKSLLIEIPKDLK